jgi:hypothetical protein
MTITRVVEYSIRILTLIALVVAAATSGYRIWDSGRHRFSTDERVGLPAIAARHYSDALLGTYIVTFSERCTQCVHRLPFYRELAVAAQHSSRPVKMVLVYPKGEATPDFLRRNNVEFPEMVPVRSLQLPAVYFVDNFGSVRGYWSGSLRENDQRRILQSF